MSNTKNTTTSKNPQVQAYLRALEASQELLATIARSKKDVLVLGGYGAQLHVRSICGTKCLIYTYKDNEPQMYMPKIHGLKKIVWMFCVSHPSSVAVQWMRREAIEFVCIDATGEDLTEKERREDDLHLQRMQFMLSDEQERDYARLVIKQKVLGQIATMRKYSYMLKNAESEADELVTLTQWFDIKNGNWVSTKNRIQQAEAKCADRYFTTWEGMKIRWIKQDEKKVHVAYNSYQHRADNKAKNNRNAHHPVNAMLNYMNAIIAHRIKLVCMDRGLHLKMSFLHARQDNRQQAGMVKPDKRDNLVYDLIETLRPAIEASLLRFLDKNELHLEWFIIDEFGAVRINFMLAQVLVLWLEKEIKDSQVAEPVDAYIAWLRSESRAMKAA